MLKRGISTLVNANSNSNSGGMWLGGLVNLTGIVQSKNGCCQNCHVIRSCPERLFLIHNHCKENYSQTN